MAKKKASQEDITRTPSRLERATRDYLARKKVGFIDDGDMLEAVAILFRLHEETEGFRDDEEQAIYIQLEKALFNWFKRARRVHPCDTYLSGIFRQYKLRRLDQDILLLLTASALGMGISTNDIDDVQKFLDLNQGNRLKVMRAFDPEERLVSSGLVHLKDRSDFLAHCAVSVDPSFILPLLKKKGTFSGGWEVETQEDLLKKLYPLTKCYEDRASQLDHSGIMALFGTSDADVEKLNKQASRLESTLERTIRMHDQWSVCKLLREDLNQRERRIVTILLCKEMRYLESWPDAGSGDELAKGISESVPEIRESLGLLSSVGDLRKKEYIRICGTPDEEKINDDPETLRQCEFELTPDVLDRLKIKRKEKEKVLSRKPVVSMDQLVLHDEVVEALDAALMQSRHHGTLFEKWGLGKTIAYGRSVTLLFSGPPGVGKTACAEALAGELNQTILLADYSKIQDCFVGGTEKNITRTFRTAREENAVLFWDEADAMFYDRDTASRNWEVRDVNVLLQELERFDGVCILSTNRKIALDKALERRISMKINFRLPTVRMAKEVWRKLLPKNTPLEKGIDFDELANARLTGGQIKNAVLNAARNAIRRGTDTRIGMEDFRWAIHLEAEGAWSEDTKSRIGFRGGFSHE